MATNHVVEEGEADILTVVARHLFTHTHIYIYIQGNTIQVVMDSLGQMKKLSKWAIFENQA